MAEEHTDNTQDDDKNGRADHLKDYWWDKGISGNPNGRPKKQVLSEAVRKILSRPFPKNSKIKNEMAKLIEEGATFGEIITFVQVIEATKGSTKAYKELADRAEGKPTQRIELSGDQDSPLQIAMKELNTLSTKDLENLKAIQQKLKKDDSSD